MSLAYKVAVRLIVLGDQYYSTPQLSEGKIKVKGEMGLFTLGFPILVKDALEFLVEPECLENSFN